MARVRIVTDSTAQLDPDIAQALDIIVVPLEIRFGTQRFQEGIDLTPEEFFRRAAHTSTLPESVAPPIEAFEQVYGALNATTHQVLSLHVSSKLNATCAHARRAANNFLGRCEIYILDSGTISLGLSILVQAAAKVAQQGMEMDDIVRLVRGMIPHIYAVFFTDALPYLERERRLSPSQAFLGKMLNIRPFLAIEEGEILPMEKVRTREKTVDKLLEFVSEFSHIERIAVVHSTGQTAKDAQTLLDRLESNFPAYEFEALLYGPTLATHVGPDSLGLIVYEGMD